MFCSSGCDYNSVFSCCCNFSKKASTTKIWYDKNLIFVSVPLINFYIADATPTDQSFSKMAPVDTTGNVDKHVFVQGLNSSHSQTASIKHPLPKLPAEKEEICKSIPDHTYPKDAVFVPPAVSNNNPNNPTSANDIHIIDNNPCYNFNDDTYY